MKLYKFRSLSNEEDYCRLKSIIETGHFRCSNFNDLNDPMEGVFSYSGEENDRSRIEQKIKEIFDEKHSYKICSFSGNEEYKGLQSPLMRCHYANSFKGIAIEIETEIGCEEINSHRKGYIEKITYKDETINTISILDASKILTRKSTARELEDEYRFLVKSDHNFHKIGTITGVYFGAPYYQISNEDYIVKSQTSKSIIIYREQKEKIEKIIGNKIKKHLVYIENGKIKTKKY